jgi:hypothetical protein
LLKGENELKGRFLQGKELLKENCKRGIVSNPEG